MTASNNRILHIDGDSFFASCEIALDSSLEGRPVWVGGGRRSDGIVIAANRLAKKYGIKTGTTGFETERLQKGRLKLFKARCFDMLVKNNVR
jgi:nucleotidyltransferase/DNA polymerase involved in DNA repair